MFRSVHLPAILILVACLTGAAGVLRASDVIPSRPTRYFNDAAGIVSAADADQLNRRLEDFERATSNQIVVAIYPQLQSDSSVEDYTVRVAQAWGVGQKGRNNGAVLFAFMKEHQLRIQVGYGLEAVLPDGLCHLIIENELKPRFRAADYAGGLNASITAMIAATKGEYKGTGRTNAEDQPGGGWPVILIFFVLIVGLGCLNAFRSRRSAVYQSTTGRRGLRSGPSMWLGGGGFGGGGGSFGGGGGGGFSGGGGSFGGGGAGGSW
jgi:uncharacterized protein